LEIGWAPAGLLRAAREHLPAGPVRAADAVIRALTPRDR
jgi:hypothetical protein